MKGCLTHIQNNNSLSNSKFICYQYIYIYIYFGRNHNTILQWEYSKLKSKNNSFQSRPISNSPSGGPYYIPTPPFLFISLSLQSVHRGQISQMTQGPILSSPMALGRTYFHGWPSQGRNFKSRPLNCIFSDRCCPKISENYLRTQLEVAPFNFFNFLFFFKDITIL